MAQEMATPSNSRPQFPHLSDGLRANTNLSEAQLGNLMNAKRKCSRKASLVPPSPAPAAPSPDSRPAGLSLASQLRPGPRHPEPRPARSPLSRPAPETQPIPARGLASVAEQLGHAR